MNYDLVKMFLKGHQVYLTDKITDGQTIVFAENDKNALNSVLRYAANNEGIVGLEYFDYEHNKGCLFAKITDTRFAIYKYDFCEDEYKMCEDLGNSWRNFINQNTL